LDSVIKELNERGFTDDDIEKLKPVILLERALMPKKLVSLRKALKHSEVGLKGCDEVDEIFAYHEHFKPQDATVDWLLELVKMLVIGKDLVYFIATF